MKFLLGVVGCLLAVFLLLPVVQGESIIHTDAADFTGTHVNTSVDGDNVTLGNETATAYYPSGNYTSPVLDVGSVVEWMELDWTHVLPSGTDIDVSLRMGNTSTPDSSWGSYFANEDPTVIAGSSQYIQYAVLFSTSDLLFTPFFEDINLTYSLSSPSVSLDDPPNNHLSSSPNVTFNCTASSQNPLVNITLFGDFGGTWAANQSTNASGTSDTLSVTIEGLADGTYLWNCETWDSDQSGVGGINHTLVIAAANAGPTISSAVVPDPVALDGNVSLEINATDSDGIDSVWAVITQPNSSEEKVSLMNNGAVSYQAGQLGNYLIVFYANDSLGAETSLGTSFTSSTPVNFSFSTSDVAAANLSTTISLLKDGVEVAASTGEVATLSTTLLDGLYDVKVISFGGDLEVMLEGIDIGIEGGKSLGLDIAPQAEGFVNVYAVDNPYAIAGATVTLRYNESDYANESFIEVHQCSSWDFALRQCTSGTFSLVGGVVHDEAANTFSFSVVGFSGFGLTQESFCGDGVCSSGESLATCQEDCMCINGQTKSCGASEVGECVFGEQTCSNGVWGPCVNEVAPVTEVCNQKDDDCDGVVDNVNGGTSAESAQCACYGGTAPSQELCNDIDDDCDGEIDGFTQACGSNIGVCEEGSKVCTAGVFGSCTGGITAAPEEVCANGQDDNCNNQVDEGCPNCFNGLQDGDEEGIDCGGSCASACEFIDLTTTFALVVLVVIVLGAVLLKLRKKKDGWSEVEKRYTYT